MRATKENYLTIRLFENDRDFGLRFSEKAKQMAGSSLEADISLWEGESDDDIAYAEVQRLRAQGLTWRDTALLSPLADKVRHIWLVLQDGFSRGYWDFLRLLEQAAASDLTFRADYVAVDEIQDLTPLQCRIVGRSEGKEVVFVGDVNQTIHAWAGVSLDEIMKLPYEKIEYQRESYRLTEQVARYADVIISQIRGSISSQIIPRNGQGAVCRDGNFSNVLRTYAANTNTLVLSRTNYISDSARRHAINQGANVVLSEQEILIKRLHDLIQEQPSTFNFSDADCLLGPWVPSKRYWLWGGKTRLKEVMDTSTTKYMSWRRLFSEFATPDLERLIKGEIYLEGLRDGFDPTKPIIRFSTIHAAKGSEEETVVVLRDIDTRVQENLWKDPDSEVRVAYVAATRAKRNLIISQLAGERMNPYII